MYVLTGNKWRRGFRLSDELGYVFKTKHKFGLSQKSSVQIDDDLIEINYVGDRCNIFKNGNKIGIFDLGHESHYTITLYRTDGSKDFFKLETPLASEFKLYCINEKPLLKFRQAWTRVIFFNKYEVEILSDAYPKEIMEELIFYAGEIIYRRVWGVMWESYSEYE